MRNNNLLTYVLYGLLGAFILAAGYYACQKQKEKKEQAALEAAELEETLREMGYASDEEPDAGSTHSGSDSIPPSAAKPAVPEQKPGGSATATPPATKDKKSTAAPAPSAKSAPSTAVAPKISSPQPPATVKGPGDGRWAVRAGTFSVMDGARKRLEQVIKAGYPNAEISKTKDGKAAVVVYRSNDKAAATRVANDLSGKGIDAAVFDRQN
jgi:cytoskeletal protein RodZ